VVGLPNCITPDDVVAYDPADNAVFAGPDPRTGVRGLKYGSALSLDGRQVYCFTLRAHYGEGSVLVVVKAGWNAEVGEVDGGGL